MLGYNKVSIIIPVYNAAKYIINCLNSIKQQSIDLEVICVNDGSTDESEKIIKEYISKNSFVKYAYQENAGASVARNKGLEIINGEYCMFFDADDILLPNALKDMIATMESENADLIVGDYNEIDEQGKKKLLIKQSDFVVNSSVYWFFALCPPLPGNKLIRKSILDDSNLKFEPLKIGQDLNFYLKLLTVAKKVIMLKQPVMGYRIVDGSISRQYSLKILDICNSMDNVKEYYKQKGFSDQYSKYVSLTELIAYRSQLEKVKYFSNKNEISQICNVFDSRIKKCNRPERSLNKIYLKERIKCFLILFKYFKFKNNTIKL